MPLSPPQCRVAPGLPDWTQDELAAPAGAGRSTLRGVQAGPRAPRETSAAVIRATPEAGGAVFPGTGAGRAPRLRPASPADARASGAHRRDAAMRPGTGGAG